MKNVYQFQLVLLISLIIYGDGVNRRRKRLAETAPSTNVDAGNIKPNQDAIVWPGQDNRLPYISQWGPWTDEQVHRGEGQKPFQPSGIQINPSQAAWFPNSPEYQGFDAKYVARLKNLQTDQVNTTRPNALYFPLSSTTVPVAAWSTWRAIEGQGIGGINRHWANWHFRPDIAGHQQEAMLIRQAQRETLPDGKIISRTNQTFADDTYKILVDVLAGFVAGTSPKKAAMYNMKTYFPQYRRHYWIGNRFFNLDPQTVLASFITCKYELPADINILYEVDDSRVNEILFQCTKYQETCCKLNCCDLRGRPLYYSALVNDGIRNGYKFRAILYYGFIFIVLVFHRFAY